MLVAAAVSVNPDVINSSVTPATWIALSSVLLSAVTGTIMLLGYRHTASTDYVAGLERRVEDLERELKDAEGRIKDLETQNGALMKENLMLFKQIAGVPNGK